MTTVYFDYACEDTYRFQRLLDMAEVTADWRPFSLTQAASATATWDWASGNVPISVLALAGHEFVKAQSAPGTKAYRQEMFRLFHEQEDSPQPDKVWQLIEKFTGFPQVELDLEAALKRVQDSHELAASKGVFATPTVFIEDNDRPFFIRLEALPETVKAAKALWKSLPKSSHHFPQPVIIEAVE